jgi:hypothetical protein
MKPRLDVPPGTVFGMLTIIRETDGHKRPGRGWKRKFMLCCSCGIERTVSLEKLRNGMIQSCGCTNRPSMLRHGMCLSPTYRVWTHMKERCLNPSCRAFPAWGGRGIKVDERWMRFENFFADMGEKPPGRSLDRIDNAGHYTPANCRWATAGEQSRNTRRTRTVMLNGVVMCIKDAAKQVGISAYMIQYRAKMMNGTNQDAVDYYAARQLCAGVTSTQHP